MKIFNIFKAPWDALIEPIFPYEVSNMHLYICTYYQRLCHLKIPQNLPQGDSVAVVLGGAMLVAEPAVLLAAGDAVVGVMVVSEGTGTAPSIYSKADAGAGSDACLTPLKLISRIESALRLPFQLMFSRVNVLLSALTSITTARQIWKMRPTSQIRQCIRQISHDAPFCNRNVHISVAKWCIMGYRTGSL